MEEAGLSKKDAERNLKDEEKALLAEDQFIEEQKKKYGRS